MGATAELRLLVLLCILLVVAKISSAAPPSHLSNYDGALVQRFRAPQQTAAQTAAQTKIAAKAAIDSVAAKPWVLQYMGSSVVRGHLDSSLQKYSNAQLLEMFEWEFKRLPIFHNAPIDAEDVDRSCSSGIICDDSSLNVSLGNGYLQQPCQRYVLGGPQPIQNVMGYES